MPRTLPPVLIPKKVPNPITVEMPRVFTVPETTQKSVVETPKLSKKNVIPKVIIPIAPTIKQELSTVALVDDQLSLEVALKLHRFIATKCGNKPFFTIEMAQFYNDGNESLKPFVQKVKVKNICITWNELLIARGSQILLANSERSQNLVNSYFAVNEPPRDSYRTERDNRRNERVNRRNELPRESYCNEQSNDSDDTELLMRQLCVMWEGTIPIRTFLKDKKQILELLNLSVSETLTSIKNCFPDEEPFRNCFSNFETKYINTNYRSLSKLCKEIILAVEEPPFQNLTKIIDNRRLITESQYTVTEVEETTDEVEATTDEVEAEVEETTGEVKAEMEATTDEVEAEMEATTDEVEAEVEVIIDDIIESVVESCL
jgi:hypothetical protein